MSRSDKLYILISILLKENPRYADIPIPEDLTGRQRLLRALENVRPPLPAREDFLELEEEELRQQAVDKGIVGLSDLKFTPDGIALWQGDITRLEADAIVNAANSEMLGCWIPLHGCIDNAIHSSAGVRLRIACNDLMQGKSARTGEAYITPGFNLPSKYVIHTVGPVVDAGTPSEKQKEELAACYRNCLDLAEDRGLGSIAFCCISTGVFHFPNELAAEIAVKTVREWKSRSDRKVKFVIFNVFKDVDYSLYKSLLA